METWATKRSQLSMNPVTLTISVDQADVLMEVLVQSEKAHPELAALNASMRDVLETLREARRPKELSDWDDYKAAYRRGSCGFVAKREAKWIPVEERLPGISDLFVHDLDGVQAVETKVESGECGRLKAPGRPVEVLAIEADGERFLAFRTTRGWVESTNCEPIEPTHWQPLPVMTYRIVAGPRGRVSVIMPACGWLPEEECAWIQDGELWMMDAQGPGHLPVDVIVKLLSQAGALHKAVPPEPEANNEAMLHIELSSETGLPELHISVAEARLLVRALDRILWPQHHPPDELRALAEAWISGLRACLLQTTPKGYCPLCAERLDDHRGTCPDCCPVSVCVRDRGHPGNHRE